MERETLEMWDRLANSHKEITIMRAEMEVNGKVFIGKKHYFLFQIWE